MIKGNSGSQIPRGWVRSKIGEVCTLVNGRAFKPSEWSSKGLPIIRIQNLNNPDAEFNYCDFTVEQKYYVDYGQLLFAWSGTPETSFGAHIWRRGKAVLNQHIFKVEIDERFIDKSFFMHLINYNVTEYIRKAHGTAGLAHITKGKFEDSFVAIPPFNEQVRIVARLEELFARLDAGVEGLRKVKAQLRRYRQAVLKYAFEGKLTEEWRKTHKDQIEPATKLLEQIKQERKRIEGNKYKELPPVDTSTLSLLPESWAWTRMGEIAKINPSPPEGGFPYDLDVSFLPMRAVEEKTGRFDLSVTRKYIEVKKGYTYFQNNDILFAKITPCMENGKIAIVDNLSSGVGFGSTEFHVIRPFLVNIPRKFIFYFLLQDGFRKDAQRNMTGSAGQLRVPSRYMENIPVPFPSISEQHAIIEEVERHFSVADKAERVANQSLKQAERLRQSVLKKAFEGKLVPQDPTDETATKLLERIREERARQMTKEGTNKIRRSKETPKEVGLMRYVK